MRNIKILLQYDGTRYSGWQSQEHCENTIQGKLTAVLCRMLREEIEVAGSGRTDAGVHALGQVANFKTRSELTCQEILEGLNKYLPEDIAVLSAEEVPDRFHSRLSATGKTYRYHIWNSRIPGVFGRRYQWTIEESLDIEAMRRAAEKLTGTHDFRGFSSIKRGKKSTVRTINEIRIEQNGAEVTLSFTGNGFLYHMVRILTGTLVEIGLHKMNVDEIETILTSGKREKAGVTAPAQGLFLVQVEYS